MDADWYVVIGQVVVQTFILIGYNMYLDRKPLSADTGPAMLTVMAAIVATTFLSFAIQAGV